MLASAFSWQLCAVLFAGWNCMEATRQQLLSEPHGDVMQLLHMHGVLAGGLSVHFATSAVCHCAVLPASWPYQGPLSFLAVC
jgi:hypothetical protein